MEVRPVGDGERRGCGPEGRERTGCEEMLGQVEGGGCWGGGREGIGRGPGGGGAAEGGGAGEGRAEGGESRGGLTERVGRERETSGLG